jgi:hypothetical protein
MIVRYDAKELATHCWNGPEHSGTGRNLAALRSGHASVSQSQLRCGKDRLGLIHLSPCNLKTSGRLQNVLFAHGVLQLERAIAISFSLLGAGIDLRQYRFGLCDFGSHWSVVELREQLTLLHMVAYMHQHLNE